MSLSDLASLGSLVNGVAVLVSLAFLYFQVRQVNQQIRRAEKNQRATIAQVRTNRTAEIGLRQTDPAVAMAFLRGPLRVGNGRWRAARKRTERPIAAKHRCHSCDSPVTAHP